MGEHKLLIATICAIMIIPFLYSVFFLKSVWDPYGNSGSLPVAVVNEDQPVKYNGKKMQVGHDLIKKLKKNHDLEWHFVSASAAQYGISHKKYYMVITIPKNFSKNATTVLDKNPKKMQLKYKTNDSLNYIGKVISEQGVKELNTQVRKSVSTAYAKTMFATIKKVGKGFDTAAKGAHKLKTGSNTLSDGINTYTAGVAKVNDGVIELQTGVVPLSSGVLKLTTGATALSSGIKEYTAGVAKVNSGTQTLNSSTGTLASGVGQLAIGSNSLASGVTSYTSGVTKVNNGIQTLNGSTGTLASGVSQLSSGSNSLLTGLETLNSKSSELNSANKKINNGLVEMQNNTKSMPEKVKELKKGTQELSEGTATLNSSVDSLLTDDNKNLLSNLIKLGNDLEKVDTSNLSQLVKSAQTLNSNQNLKNLLKGTNSESLTKLESQLEDIDTVLQNIDTTKTTLSSIQNQLMSTILPTIDNQQLTVDQAKSELSSLQNQQAAQAFIQGLMTGSVTISDNSSLGAAIDSILEEVKAGNIDRSKAPAVLANVITKQATVMSTQLKAYESLLELKENVMSKLNTKEEDISSIRTQISLINGIISDKQDILVLINAASGISNEDIEKLNYLATVKSEYAANSDNLNLLVGKWDELKSNIALLNSGAQQVNSGVGELETATPTLTNGISQLLSGSTLVMNGTSEYTSGVSAASSGASQLSSGLGTLNSNVPSLTSGVSQLASGTSQLVANNSMLTSGAYQLSSGLGTLNSKVPTLVSGVSQLASGTQTLTNNSSTLNNGASELASGLSTLNNKVPTLTSGVSQLASGTKQLNDNSSQLTQGADKLASGNKALAVALKKGSKQVNSVQTSNKTANMFAAPSNLKHSNYSKVQNYGYALAPYMLSVALFVGSLVFNLVYPIRRMAAAGTGTEWFLSKVSVGALVATGNALIETLFMMACGLVPMHPVAMIVNALFFSYSAMFLIMFMSMLGNNPGRFVAMILLVIQLGACGGSFPIQITNGMNGFFQAINPYLPMTYSVLGFREALNSGLGSGQILTSIGVLSIFIIVCLFLLWLTMTTFVKKGIVSYDENIPDSNYPGN